MFYYFSRDFFHQFIFSLVLPQMSGRSSLKLGDRNEEANLRRLLVEKIDELLDMPQSGFPYFIDGK